MTALLIGAMYLESPYKSLHEIRSCKIYIAETVEITDYITLQGKVIEQKRQEIYSKYPAKILSVNVQQGQAVEKGQVLMTLCTETQEQTAAVFYSEVRSHLENMQTSVFRPEIPSVIGQNDLKYAIVSPMDGTVMDIYYEVGERTSGIFPCIAVSDLTALAVEAEISEENSRKIQPGLSCSIDVPAAGLKALQGNLSSVAPYAATGSLLEQNSAVHVRVEAAICETTSDLRPGFTAKVKIQTGMPEWQIVLPYNCIAQDEEGEYVLCPGWDQTLIRKSIIAGRELPEGIEVLAGLEPGTAIIEDPENFTEGERVEAE